MVCEPQRGAYTYLSARDADTDLTLTGRHRHHGHVRVSWAPAASGFRASLRGTFFSSWIAARATAAGGVQDTVAPRFALWDAFLSQRLGGRLSGFLAVDNLADSQDPNTGVVLPDGSAAPSRAHRSEKGHLMSKIRNLVLAVAAVVMTCTSASAGERGILLLAHGGNEQWNAQVTRIASDVDRTHPTEVAFGMATRANIQAAIDRLRARGATEIVAVPLFISSWSSVITSTEYLLGQREEAPKELAIFAKMNHFGSHGAGGHGAPANGSPGEHDGHAMADPTAPIESSVPVRMTKAMNDHPIVADILTDRARSVSSDPAGEAVVIVAHGPVADEENQRWLADMRSLAGRVNAAGRFAAVDSLTLRDDAPKPVRDAATAELRKTVSGHLDAGRRVLVVPLLVSFGGIEKGLRERLDGLSYTMPTAALIPDDRIVTWVLEMANGR